jgi:hypothetical protein
LRNNPKNIKTSVLKPKSFWIFQVLALFLFAILSAESVKAQSIPVGDIREEHFLLMQLLADPDSSDVSSFSNRSIWMESYRELVLNSGRQSDSAWNRPFEYKEFEVYPGIRAGIYDLSIGTTYNSELPYGENNAAAWYGRGHNVELFGGFYLTSEYFTISLRPQIVYQENRDFPVPRFIPTYHHTGEIRYVAEGITPEDSLSERIDRPFRFGPDAYTTFDLGHSSIRGHYGSFEGGLSTEPLWWGPGKQYALVMSNNAAGIAHAFLGTREPFELPYDIGKIEFRWMIGLPQDSDYFDLDLDASPNKVNRKYREMLLGNRIMHGLNLVYSPSFIDNFHIGFSRVLHQYRKEGCSIAEPTWDLNCDIQPIPPQKQQPFNPFAIFRPLPRIDADQYTGFRDESHYQNKNGLSSLFFRWVWPESHAEIYAEFYREDRSYNFRDLLTQPQHARAYTFGVRKLYDTKRLGVIAINTEFNSLLPGLIDFVRPQTYYYTHKSVKQGHTNRGQVLGAAIGPGSTSQYLSIDSYTGWGNIGFFVQRMVDNDMFHYEYYQRFFPEGGFKDQYRHQAKLNIGIRGRYIMNNVVLNAGAVWNKHFEYGRHNYAVIPIAWHDREREDIINLQFQMNVQYRF